MMRKKRDTAPVEKPVKPEVKPKPTGKVVNPSEKLATMLRKEGMLAARVQKAQAELRAVQSQITQLWDERQEKSRELLSDDLEVS